MGNVIYLSKLFEWHKRTNLPDCAGLYVISKGDQEITIYIGRTWGKNGIKKRIRDFHRSATTGRAGHAGGVTYNSTFGAEVGDLYVRCHEPLIINPDPAILRPYIEYAERKLIWEHVEQHGVLPACNSE